MAGLFGQRLCSSLRFINQHGSLSLLVKRAVLSPNFTNQCQRRFLATTFPSQQKQKDTSHIQYVEKGDESGQEKSAIVEALQSQSSRKTALTPAEKVVEAGKDAGYSMAGIFGLGMLVTALGALVYNELGGAQPSAIYRRSLRLVRRDKQVQNLVGSPFKAFGYSGGTMKGYRSNVYSVDYLMGAGDELHRQVKYNIKGKLRQAVVTVDMKEIKKGSGRFDYYNISVATPGAPAITVLDNRYSDISLASYQALEVPSSPTAK